MHQTLELHFFSPDNSLAQAQSNKHEITHEDDKLILPNLDSKIAIRFTEECYYLLLNEQLVPLQDGTILQGEHFTIKVHLKTVHHSIEHEAINKEVAQNIKEDINNFSAYISNLLLNESPKENGRLLDNSAEAESQHDELAFLFKNNNTLTHSASYRNHSTYVAGNLENLAVLSQYFQPLKIEPSKAINITASAKALPIQSDNIENNILQDLGFNLEYPFNYKCNTHIHTLPAPFSGIFSYKDEETEANIFTCKNSSAKHIARPLIKKLWQKISDFIPPPSHWQNKFNI